MLSYAHTGPMGPNLLLSLLTVAPPPTLVVSGTPVCETVPVYVCCTFAVSTAAAGPCVTVAPAGPAVLSSTPARAAGARGPGGGGGGGGCHVGPLLRPRFV